MLSDAETTRWPSGNKTPPGDHWVIGTSTVLVGYGSAHGRVPGRLGRGRFLAAGMRMSKASVFISYSHRDARWKDRLLEHLGGLPDELGLQAWSDSDIGVGEKWYDNIVAAVDEANIAVLLISAPFLVSKFIKAEEIPRLLERRDRNELCIYPILIKACAWQEHRWLSEVQLRPPGGRPLWGLKAANVENHLAKFAVEIAGIAKAPVAPVHATRPSAAGEAPLEQLMMEPRSATSSGVELIAETSRVAGDAVRAVATSSDEGIRAIVERFNNEFAAVSNVIDALTYYKDLHDELHRVEFHCYGGLLVESRRRKGDPINWDAIAEHELTLLASINQLQAIVEDAGLRDYQTSWIPMVVASHRHLTAAIENHDSNSLRSAVSLLSRVLTVEPIKLNDRMRDVTRGMELAALERALEVVRERMSAMRLDPARLEKVRAGIDALDSLGNAVKRLVREHDQWQELEFNLRRVESSLAGGVDEVEYSWPMVRSLAEGVYKDRQEQWANSLGAAAKQVQLALDATVSNRHEQVALQFRHFRRRAGDQFLRVDTMLRKVCGELGRVGEPLLVLLRTVEGS